MDAIYNFIDSTELICVPLMIPRFVTIAYLFYLALPALVLAFGFILAFSSDTIP